MTALSRAMVGSSECACNDHALDVRRALVDLADTDVAIDLGEAIFFQVAVTAQGLDGARDHRFSDLRCDEFSHRSFFETGQRAILQTGRVQNELPRRFETGCEIGEPEADRLMFDDCLSHRPALFCVAHRNFERSVSHADRLGCDTDPAGLEIAERNAIAMAW